MADQRAQNQTFDIWTDDTKDSKPTNMKKKKKINVTILTKANCLYPEPNMDMLKKFMENYWNGEKNIQIENLRAGTLLNAYNIVQRGPIFYDYYDEDEI